MYLEDLLGDAYKEGMTAEEISKALESKKDKESAEVTKLKAQLSKANSEAADYKKQLKEKMSQDEIEQAEKKAEYEKILNENKELKRASGISDKKAKLVAMGYEESLAEATATAMLDGDMDTVLANQAKYNEAQKKSILAEKMKDTKRPEGGKGNEAITLKDLRAMSSADRYAFSQEHPEEYKQLYEGGNE